MTEYGNDYRGAYASINGAAAGALALHSEDLVGRIMRPYLRWFATGEMPAPLPDKLENDILQKLIIDQQGRARTAQQNQANGRKGGRPKRTQAAADELAPCPTRPRRDSQQPPASQPLPVIDGMEF